MPFELQIQIGVRKPAGTPVLRNDHLARLRLEFGPELAAPGAEFECLMRPGCFLNGRNVIPILVVARTVTTMHGIEDPKFRLPCCLQNLQHIRNALISFCYGFDAIPYLASLRNEVVIGIDHEKGSDRFVIG